MMCSLCLILQLILLTIKGIDVGDYLYYDDLNGKPYTIGYDERSFIINGTRTLFLGGAIHYPRVPYYQWKEMLINMKSDGLNHIQTYIYWNIHEPTYNFNGTHIYNYNDRANITKYLQIAKDVGMFVNVRIGPFVNSEWKFGGLPPYLLHVNGLIFRDNNHKWKTYMEIFVKEIATKIKPYTAQYGGPVFLSQIENEYHGKGPNATLYINWCADLAYSLNLSIPFGMCNGLSSNKTINTCNGRNCYTKYVPTHSQLYPGQPLAWTEDESGFEQWTGKEYTINETCFSNRSP
eukprot:451354_1